MRICLETRRQYQSIWVFCVLSGYQVYYWNMQIMAIIEELKGKAKRVKSLQVAYWLFKDTGLKTESKPLLFIRRDFKRTTRTQKAGMIKQKCERGC